MSLIPMFKIGIWNAWVFMSVFVLQMLVVMLVGKSVKERTHVPTEARRNRFEKHTGIIANFVWLLALGYSIFLPLRTGTIWFYAGLSIFLIGLTFMAIATFNFVTATSGQLITSGAYKYSRHPVYFATFLICLGSGIASVSSLFIFISIVMAFCLHREALIEERFCVEKYDRAYREYINRVPRWIGLPRRIG